VNPTQLVAIEDKNQHSAGLRPARNQSTVITRPTSVRPIVDEPFPQLKKALTRLLAQRQRRI